METKTCSGCKTEKLLSDYNKKSKGKQTFCKECNRKKCREYYAKNREHHKKVTMARKNKNVKENKNKLREIKESVGCYFCEENEPFCLDFHHTKDKEESVSYLVCGGFSWENILNEIKKCVLVCANCHRKIHIGLLKFEGDPLSLQWDKYKDFYS